MDSYAGIIDCHVCLGEEHHLRLDVGELARRMAEAGIETAIARPMGAEVAAKNREGNERVLSAGKGVRGLATANPWFGREAVGELEWALNKGAVGVYLHPVRQGFMPTDPVVRPVWELAEGRGVPVVVHTGTYVQADVLAVAEVARRYPRLTVICDAAGWSDMWFELPGVMGEVGNLMVIASMIWGKAVGNAVKLHGAGRILFGSGEPRDRVGAALRRIERVEMSEGDRRAILWGNARRVFKVFDVRNTSTEGTESTESTEGKN